MIPHHHHDNVSCPLCGSDTPSEGIIVSLNADIAVVDGVVIKLGPVLAPLLYVLAKHKYTFVSTNDLYAAVYGQNQPETEALYQLIRSLRKALQDTSWQIGSQRTSGQSGYMLARTDILDLDQGKLDDCLSALERLGVPLVEAAEAVRGLIPKRRT